MSTFALFSFPWSDLEVFPIPTPSHRHNSMGGTSFNHDVHAPLHQFHTNQLGIVGNPVVHNMQEVG